MEFDLHIHTSRYSGCSTIDAEQLLKKAESVRLDGIALTDHGIRWSEEDIACLIRKSGVKNLIVLPGQEVACYSTTGRFQGEFLVFGYSKSLGSSHTLESVLELVHGAGGVVIAAHPYKKRDDGVGFYGAGNEIYDTAIDGLEVEHPDYDVEGRLLARRAAEQLRVAGIGCSDAHELGAVGCCRTVFAQSVHDIPTLCEEIRAGHLEARQLRACS